MNYIVLINRFWQLRRKMRIGNTEADLYYFLLQESNLRNWENPFSCPNMLICVSIGITEKTLIRARNGLAEKGLIEYRPGRRKAASPVYTLLEPSETEMTCKTERKREGMKGELERGITEGKSGNFLYKRNKTKRNNLSEKEFFEKNPVIRLYVRGKWIECPIVSCRIVRDSDGEPYRSPQSAEKQEEYFARMREASLYDTGLRPGNGDRLITLSTCHGTGKRLIVQALVFSSDFGYNRQSGSEEASQEEQGEHGVIYQESDLPIVY